MTRRRAIAIALCCLLPAAIAMVWVERLLLEQRILNTKDLPPFVGKEHGTVRDYLLNVWHWDAAILLLFVLSVPCMAAGIRMLLHRPRSAPRAS